MHVFRRVHVCKCVSVYVYTHVCTCILCFIWAYICLPVLTFRKCMYVHVSQSVLAARIKYYSPSSLQTAKICCPHLWRMGWSTVKGPYRFSIWKPHFLAHDCHSVSFSQGRRGKGPLCSLCPKGSTLVCEGSSSMPCHLPRVPPLTPSPWV